MGATTKRQKLVKELDKLVRHLARERDGVCQKCATPHKLECSHVVGRGNMSLRWDLVNVKMLCCGCHKWWHSNPQESRAWFADTFPYREQSIQRKLLKSPRPIGIQELKNNLQDLKNYEVILF